MMLMLYSISRSVIVAGRESDTIVDVDWRWRVNSNGVGNGRERNNLPDSKLTETDQSFLQILHIPHYPLPFHSSPLNLPLSLNDTIHGLHNEVITMEVRLRDEGG